MLAVAPLAYYLVAIFAAVRFFHGERGAANGGVCAAGQPAEAGPRRGFASLINFESFLQTELPRIRKFYSA